MRHLHQPFDIEIHELDDWQQNFVQQSFFEVVYVMEGEGTQRVNNNTFEYHKGHLFLLTPQDKNSFRIKKRSKFIFIRFTEVYFDKVRGQTADDGYGDWFRNMEFIFYNHSHRPGCILKKESDRFFVAALIEGMVREYINRDIYYEQVVNHALRCLLNILARNISFGTSELCENLPEKSPAHEILIYIQREIYDPEKIRVDALAEHFNLSPTYLGEFFKKHTGQSLQQFVSAYRLRLIEARLAHSSMRVSQIVHELGLTDESHLNRIFKKHYGMSPLAYRKMHRQEMETEI